MARQATIRLEVLAGDARSELERLEGDLSDVEVQAREAGNGFQGISNRATRELAETRVEMQRTETAARSMNRSVSGSANQLGFELVQAGQDARHSMAGVTNQLPLMTEQFTRLRSQAGGNIAALKQLGGALAGPAGLIAAITFGLPVIKDLISGFTEVEKKAKDAAETTEQLKEATSEILDVEGDLPTGRLNLEEARALNREIQKQTQSIQSQLDFATRLRNAYRNVRETRQQVRTLEQLEAANQLDEQQRQTLSRQRDELEQQEKTLNSLRKQSQFVLGTRVRSEEVAKQQVQRLEEKLSKNQGIAQQVQGRVEELNREEQQLERLKRVAKELGVEVSFQKDEQQKAAEAIGEQVSAAEDLLGILQDMSTVLSDMDTMSRLFPGQASQVEAAPVGDAGQAEVLAPSERQTSARLRGALEGAELAGSPRELGQRYQDQTQSGTEEGISLGSQAGAAAFQGTMSTAISEVTRQMESDFARAITSAVLQALSSAAVEKLTNLLESDSGGSGSGLNQGLNLANSLLQLGSGGAGSGGGFPIPQLSSAGRAGSSAGLSSLGPALPIALPFIAAFAAGMKPSDITKGIGAAFGPPSNPIGAAGRGEALGRSLDLNASVGTRSLEMEMARVTEAVSENTRRIEQAAREGGRISAFDAEREIQKVKSEDARMGINEYEV